MATVGTRHHHILIVGIMASALMTRTSPVTVRAVDGLAEPLRTILRIEFPEFLKDGVLQNKFVSQSLLQLAQTCAPDERHYLLHGLHSYFLPLLQARPLPELNMRGHQYDSSCRAYVCRSMYWLYTHHWNDARNRLDSPALKENYVNDIMQLLWLGFQQYYPAGCAIQFKVNEQMAGNLRLQLQQLQDLQTFIADTLAPVKARQLPPWATTPLESWETWRRTSLETMIQLMENITETLRQASTLTPDAQVPELLAQLHRTASMVSLAQSEALLRLPPIVTPVSRPNARAQASQAALLTEVQAALDRIASRTSRVMDNAHQALRQCTSSYNELVAWIFTPLAPQESGRS